jgi:N-acyl-L-homoserine lactone synthetase
VAAGSEFEESGRAPDVGVTPRWLASAEGLSRWLVERARPVRFDLARTPAELEAVFRLRYRVSVEEGWRRPEEMPDGLERDEYDDEDVAQIAAWDGSRLAGTARVVYPSGGKPLPTEAAFGLVVEPRGRVVDAGRLIVAPEHRDGEHRVLGGLAACIWTAMASRDFQWAAVAISQPMIEFSRALGFDVLTLGAPRPYWGEERFPARLTAPDPSAWTDLSGSVARRPRRTT